MGTFFTRLDFSVTYGAGSNNTNADALSRQHDCSSPSNPEETLLPDSLIVAPVQWDIMTELDQVNLQEPSPHECPPDKTFVPQELRRKVIQHVHSVLSSGHPRITATLHLL